MKKLALIAAAVAFVAVGSWAVARACQDAKNARAARPSSSCSAARATACCGSTAGAAAGATGRTVEAVAVGGGACASQHATKAVVAGTVAHGDCEACEAWALCQAELDRAGAAAQLVPLKNGVMYVFTADTPRKALLVQAALARRQEHLNALTAAGDKARLCPACKEMRGAALSGKLEREVINIEGGCIVMMTSTDPVMVSKIYAQAGVRDPSRAKI